MTYTLIIINGVIIALAVYLYAASIHKSLWIKHLQRELEVKHKELREWQNKALLKHGTSPLDRQATRAGKMKKQEITPKVVTRQQLEYREADSMQTPINIHANDVSYQRVARTEQAVEKVGEIIAAYK